MNTLRYTTIAAFSAMLLGTVAAQEQLSLEVAIPVVTMPSEPFRPAGHAADFLGVSLTQTINDVRNIMNGEGFADNGASGQFLLDEDYYKVEIIATGPNRYVSSMFWLAPEDAMASGSMKVDFSSPLSGQRSIEIHRFVNYKRGQEPQRQTLRAAILEKFGPPSADGTSRMAWYWRDGQLVPQGPSDKEMRITLETTRGDYVGKAAYLLSDTSGKQSDRDTYLQYARSVEAAAKQLRDSQVSKPDL